MPRTKGSYYSPIIIDEDKPITERDIASIDTLSIGGLDLPPYRDDENKALLMEWMFTHNEQRRKDIMKELWREWRIKEKLDKEKVSTTNKYVCNKEADGLSPTASGEEKEEEELTAKDPAAPIEIQFMEVEEESDDLSSSESVGVVPNLSEDDGEMSAPIIIEDDEEMSALASSRGDREMSAPIVSRNIEEMSALNIPVATWRAAIVGDCSLNIQTRERIIAEVLKPQFVVPPKGSREWELLDHVVMMERRRQDMIWRQSLLPEKRDEGLRKRLALDSFYKATKCGRLRSYSAPVRRHLLLHLLN